MTTSEPTNQSHIQQTLFVEDSLVRTSAKQAVKQVSLKKLGQVSFLNSCESFAWFDQSSSSWRTSQRSLITDWELYSENWPRQGSIVNGHAYLQVLWEPVIKELDGGLLPTPLASAMNRKVKFNQGGTPLLGALLPTPCSRDYKDSGPNMNYEKAAQKSRLPGVIVESRSNKTGNDTYLNPSFVEEMMGYPIGYTDLKH